MWGCNVSGRIALSPLYTSLMLLTISVQAAVHNAFPYLQWFEAIHLSEKLNTIDMDLSYIAQVERSKSSMSRRKAGIWQSASEWVSASKVVVYGGEKLAFTT